MIMRRLSQHLRRQDWTAIAIELLIVILGVFIAMQVSNWNDARLRRQDTRELLEQLRPELQAIAAYGGSARAYYSVTGGAAMEAFAGWRGEPRVSDERFVIAAYQASQISGFGTNGDNWALIFGAERLRDIEDERVRRALMELMVFNYDNLELPAISTRYREQVRRVVPDSLQRLIRGECGDRRPPGSISLNMLPSRCAVDLPDEEASRTAAALRARPDLAEDLRWHESVIAAFLFNARTLELHAQRLARLLEQRTATAF